MTAQKSSQRNWLTLVGILWCVAGIVCLLPAGSVLLFFDQPSPSGTANYFFIGTILSFPFICLLAGLGVLVLKNRAKILAWGFSALPVLCLCSIFVSTNLMNLASCGKFDCSTPFLKNEGNDIQLAKCPPPVPDGGDGLETTGCGTLKIGETAGGATKRTSEAQNWQLSATTGRPLTIKIENDGKSCPQVVLLDANGKLVQDFEDRNNRNKLAPCLSGMVTTSYYYFTPSMDGIYTLRIFTPITPGSYWLKIE